MITNNQPPRNPSDNIVNYCGVDYNVRDVAILEVSLIPSKYNCTLVVSHSEPRQRDNAFVLSNVDGAIDYKTAGVLIDRIFGINRRLVAERERVII